MKKISGKEVLDKVIESGLVGRGGAGYSTAVKWDRMSKNNHELIYMVVNGSEGEPLTKKDEYILDNKIEMLMRGVAYAYKLFSQTKTIYIYLRKDLYARYKRDLERLGVKFGLPVEVFREPGGYLCGENTTLINTIDKKRWEPRLKPPYCSVCGIHEKPTLVNNIETYYRVAEIVEGKYDNNRFYTILGEIKNPGVYDEKNKIKLLKLLKKTSNNVNKDNFVQVGGGASGKYYFYDEFSDLGVDTGTGSIMVYDVKKNSFNKLVKQKVQFALEENCGKCTPCREGVYRLWEMCKNNIKEKEYIDICDNMAKTSFCGLGQGVGASLLSLIEKKDKIWS